MSIVNADAKNSLSKKLFFVLWTIVVFSVGMLASLTFQFNTNEICFHKNDSLDCKVNEPAVEQLLNLAQEQYQLSEAGFYAIDQGDKSAFAVIKKKAEANHQAFELLQQSNQRGSLEND